MLAMPMLCDTDHGEGHISGNGTSPDRAVVAVFMIESDAQRGPFSEEDVALLQGLADVAGGIINQTQMSVG